MIRGSCGFNVSHGKSAPFLIWCWSVSCWGRYNLFNLSRYLTRPTHSGATQIYASELFAVRHRPDKFCDHRHCDNGDAFNLTRDITWLHVYTFMWICFAIFGGHWFTVNEDVVFNHFTWSQISMWLKNRVTL